MNAYHHGTVRSARACSIRVTPVFAFMAAIIFVLAHASMARASNRYWVGGTGDWSDDTNHWASSSGGSPGDGNLPTSSDDVFIDDQSGFGSGGTVTLDVAGECHDFTCASGDNYSFVGTEPALNCYGSLTLESGMTFSIVSLCFYPATSGNTITTAGVLVDVHPGAPIGFYGTGEILLQDDFTTTGSLDIESGIFDANDHDVTAGTGFGFYATQWSADNGPTIYMGSGIWESTGVIREAEVSDDWHIEQRGSKTVTIVPETSTIILNVPAANDATFFFWDALQNETGKTYNNLWLTGVGTGEFIVYGDNTFNEFKIDPGLTVKFTEATTTTLTSLSAVGEDGSPITLDSVDGTTQFTLFKTGGSVACDYLDLNNSNASGTATWYAGANSVDTTNNDGWLFQNPQRDLYWVGGSGDWTDITHWSFTSNGTGGEAVPTSTDDVFIDTNSGFGAGGTITVGGAECHNFLANSGHSYSIESPGGSLTFYGFVDIETTADCSTLATNFDTSTSITIDLNGTTLLNASFGDVISDGTYTLLSDFECVGAGSAGLLNVTSGTFDANDFNVTAANFYFFADTGYTATVIMGSGTWEITESIDGNGGWLIDEYNDEVVTITPETSTIKLSKTDAGDKTFAGLGKTYNNIWLAGDGSGEFIFVDENTFHDFKVDEDNSITMTTGTTTLTGSMLLGSGVAFTDGDTFAFTCSGSETVTTNGVTIPNVVFSGSGELTLLDNLTAGSYIQITNGTFDANDHDIEVSNDKVFIGASTGSVPTVNMGSGTWSVAGDWELSEEDGEVVTINCETSTIILTSANQVFNTIETNKTYNNLWFAGYNINAGNSELHGNNTFNELRIDADNAQSIRFSAGSTQTVTTFIATGSTGKEIVLNSYDQENQFNLSCVSGIISCDYLDLSNSNATGGATWYAGSHSLDTFNNDGWIFAAAPTATPANYAEWIAQYPGVGAEDAEGDDPDGDGWSNRAEYGYWSATGEESAPADSGSSGQAIALEPGWNLIGISADVCYYTTGAEPAEGARAMIPASPGNYEAVGSIGSLLAGMGIGGEVEKIAGWHPPPEGGAKGPVLWEGESEMDSLHYIAGGYGYWVKARAACTWKIAGKPRLKGLGEAKGVALAPGWNTMGPLFAKVHYEGTNPAAMFGSDETGREEETNICDYLRGLVTVEGSGAPEAVEAMISYDSIFPFVRTYYAEVPPFLQTLKYAGPGMGMLIKMDPDATGAVTLEYPAE